MDNLIIVIIVALVVGIAVCYIVKAKKKGVKCVGCPYAKECSAKKKCDCNTK